MVGEKGVFNFPIPIGLMVHPDVRLVPVIVGKA
jgi:hypothetical protein